MDEINEKLKIIRERVEIKRARLAKIKTPTDDEVECVYSCFYCHTVNQHIAYHEELKNNMVWAIYKKQIEDESSKK